MSFHHRSLPGVVFSTWLARLTLALFMTALCMTALSVTGCTATPSMDADEEEDIEAQTLHTTMLRNRGHLEPKGGLVIPTSSKYDPAAGAGLRGQIEAVMKGMWLGLDFDYASVDSSSALTRGSSEPDQLSADTEDLMKSFERYQVLFTWDYDI